MGKSICHCHRGQGQVLVSDQHLEVTGRFRCQSRMWRTGTDSGMSEGLKDNESLKCFTAGPGGQWQVQMCERGLEVTDRFRCVTAAPGGQWQVQVSQQHLEVTSRFSCVRELCLAQAPNLPVTFCDILWLCLFPPDQLSPQATGEVELTQPMLQQNCSYNMDFGVTPVNPMEYHSTSRTELGSVEEGRSSGSTTIAIEMGRRRKRRNGLCQQQVQVMQLP